MDLVRTLFDSYEDDFYSFSEEETLKNLCEMNELCEDIVLNCKNSRYKYDALNYLSLVANLTCNVTKMQQYIIDLPEMFRSFEPLMVRISTGEKREWIIDNYLREMDIEICNMLLEKSKNKDRNTILNNYQKSCAVHDALSDTYVFDLIRDGQITDWWELFISVEEWEMLLKSLGESIEKANQIADMILPENKKHIYSLLLTHLKIFVEWSEDKLVDSEYYDFVMTTIKEGENLIKSKVVGFIG